MEDVLDGGEGEGNGGRAVQAELELDVGGGLGGREADEVEQAQTNDGAPGIDGVKEGVMAKA